MRFGPLAAWGLCCAAVLSSSGCTRTLDFDALAGDEVDLLPDGGVDPPVTSRPATEGLDGGFACRLLTPRPLFCDDFDGRPLDDSWDQILTSPADGGTVAHDSDDSVSPTNSLLVTVARGIPASTYVSMGLHRVLSEWDGRGKIAIDFDLKVEAFDSTLGRNLVAFQLLFGETRPGTERNQLVLDVHSAGTGLSARFNENLLASTGISPTSETHELRAQPAFNRWTHVSFTLHVAAPPDGKNQVVLRIGPRDAPEREIVTLYQGPLRHELRAGQPLMEVGIPWLDTERSTADWRIRYDNVLVRIE